MIYLPPPQPVLNKDIRISGDVEIHPTASLAPGVILQAAPNHRIVIGADVCIGMGVIVNASQGSIEIGSGAIVGSGVLIIGACTIGNNACIGTAVTIFQTDVDAMTVIEPGSVLGDASRKLDVNQQQQNSKANSSSSPQQPPNNSQQPPNNSPQNQGKYTQKYAYTPQSKQTPAENLNQEATTPSMPSVETAVSPATNSNKQPVVGQVYINQLLVTLFPHNKDLNSRTKKLG